MEFQGAVIKEQGVTFAVVVVKEHVIRDHQAAQITWRQFAPWFSGMPVVLMAQDHRGTPTYWGRPDLARFLANLSLGQIPWKNFTVN
jgi:hypothetical protein